MNREMNSDIVTRDGQFPIVHATGQGTVNGPTNDTRGFDSATLVLQVSAIVAAGVVTYKLQDGDAANMSDAADVAAADLAGAFATLLQNTTQHVGYRGSKRYIRAVATYVSGTSVAHGASFVMAHASIRPAV